MRQLENNPQWSNVQRVSQILSGAGFKAYLAGGCVRDAVLGITPNDFDIATDASPDQVEELFVKSVSVGKAFGVIVVPFSEGSIEIASFRSDGKYIDGRRPETIVYSSPSEDAMRRDFTVNALFFDLAKGEIVDFVNGLQDLDLQLLKAVGDAEARFEEDGLRLLRAIRFSSQLGFALDSETYRSIRIKRHKVHAVSVERVRDELLKMINSKRPSMALQLLYDSGLGELIFGSANNSYLSATKKAFEALTIKSEALTLSVLYSEKWASLNRSAKGLNEVQQYAKLFVEKNVLPWKVSKRTVEDIKLYLVALVVFRLQKEYLYKELRRFFSNFNSDHLTAFLSCYKGTYLKSCFDSEWKELQSLCRPLPEALITGSDVIEHGFSPGPEIKSVLDEGLDRQIEGKIENRKQALAWLKSRSSN